MRVIKTARPLAAAVACACVFAVSALNTPANATAGTPIQGTPVGLDHDPEGIIAHGTTDSKGNVTFEKLPAGHYTLVIDGKSLAASLKQMAPKETAAKKESGPSVNLGVGGLFGSKSSSTSKSDPVKGTPSHGTSSSSGVGLGLNIPIGSKDDPEKPTAMDSGVETVVVTARFKGDLGGGWSISTSAPVCPSAQGDIRLSFDIPENGSVSIRTEVGGAIDEQSSTQGAD